MKRKLNIFIASAFFFMIIISYQNCGTSQQGSLFGKTSYNILPYEFKINQISYLSCAEQDGVANDQGVFFTFRAGAYDNAEGTPVAGFRLTEDFLYDTRRKSNSQRMDLLFEDVGTSLSRLQLATRRANALNSMFVNQNTGGGTEEIDFDFIFGDMGSDEMSAALLTAPPGQYMNYWSPAGVNRDAYFEGTLVYNASEALAQQVRTFFSQDGILAWAYADTSKPASLRSPAMYDVDDANGDGIEEPVVTNKALGTGYKLTFRQPLPSEFGYGGGTTPHANMPKRVLQTIYEYDLTTQAGSSQWTCPTSLQMRVIFPDDIWVVGNPKNPNDDANFIANPNGSGKLCPQREDTHSENSGTADLRAKLAIVRRSLPISDWYVNLTASCIIPKRYTMGSCYGIDQGSGDTRSPEYNVTAKCNPAINSTGTGVCSHFFSVCYKN